jgi:enoyl-CoA hydratase/carnithine racemase
MPQIMGNQRASLALYTGDWISAEDAVAADLALRVVPADHVVAETMAIARRIAEQPLFALVESKRIVLAGRLEAIKAARAREDAAFARMLSARAGGDALDAFLADGTPP